jgi:ComF family protein
MKKRPPFSWCRGLYRYRGAVAEVILKFKYGGRMSLKAPLLGALHSGISGLVSLPEVDILIPVPLSFRGRWQRGFNQSHILALPVARRLGLEIRADALKKRGSRTQVGLTAAQRAANAAASYLPGPSLDRVRDRKVLLFDDVYTTGATVWACAGILKKAGAEVSVLTFARA